MAETFASLYEKVKDLYPVYNITLQDFAAKVGELLDLVKTSQEKDLVAVLVESRKQKDYGREELKAFVAEHTAEMNKIKTAIANKEPKP